MLGYGSLGRETARLLQAHGMRIVAANTSGEATPQDGVSGLEAACLSSLRHRAWHDFGAARRVAWCTAPHAQVFTASLPPLSHLLLLCKSNALPVPLLDASPNA